MIKIITLFSEINKAAKKLSTERKVVQTNAEIKMVNKKLKALRAVSAYIKGGTWATKDTFKERVNYVLTHDRAKAAKHFGVSRDSINTSMSLANSMLVKILGEDIIKQIMSGNPEVAMLRVMQAKGEYDTSNLVFKDVLALMPEPTISNDIKLSECIKELKFVKGCSIKSLKNSISKIDETRLAHVLGVLNNSTDSKLRMLVYSFIEDEDAEAYNNLISYLSEIESSGE